MIKLTPPDESVILLTAAEAAEMFGVAERTWRTWDSGRPRPASSDHLAVQVLAPQGKIRFKTPVAAIGARWASCP